MSASEATPVLACVCGDSQPVVGVGTAYAGWWVECAGCGLSSHHDGEGALSRTLAVVRWNGIVVTRQRMIRTTRIVADMEAEGDLWPNRGARGY